MAYKTIEDTIGNTPLVQLVRLTDDEIRSRNNVVLAKLEGNNPAGSVKDRRASGSRWRTTITSRRSWPNN